MNTGSISLKPGKFILSHRVPLSACLLAFTAFMFIGAARVRIATRFIDFFPSSHPYVQLYQNHINFGGADRVIIMLTVEHGNIFQVATLRKVQSIQRELRVLPGVNPDEIFSLASDRVTFLQAVPGGIVSHPFMYPHVPDTAGGLAELKHNVDLYPSKLRNVVSSDGRSAIVTAVFDDTGLDYRALFTNVQSIARRYADADTQISIAGEPIVRGYGYYYMPLIGLILAGSLGIMVVVLYFTLRDRSRWWVPLATGSFSAIWGLGFVGLMHYDFDPVMLVIPFILTARDMSHGIQWQRRFYDEIERLGDKYAACVATTDAMLPPGILSILADIAGIIFISFGGVPVLRHIGLGGSVWLAGSLTMVFVFQPIMVSFLPAPEPRTPRLKSNTVARVRDRVVNAIAAFPARQSLGRDALLAGAVLFALWGVLSGMDAKVGYELPGTPLYRPNSRINRDLGLISRVFPADEGWVVLTGPHYPDPQSAIGPEVLRLAAGLHDYLLLDPHVVRVDSFASDVIMPANSIFHYGYPKYYSTPSSIQLAGNLWSASMSGSAPGEMQRYFPDTSLGVTCIRIFLHDHTDTTLQRLRREIEAFIKTNVDGDPALSQVKIQYLGSSAGLYLAANDVLKTLDFLNISFVLAVIFIFCVISFRSFVAGLLLLFACILANFGAFIYLSLRGIGITIDTIPVISLGIGLGIDYGIYMVARIRDEVAGGSDLEVAIKTAIQTTGSAVFSTFLVMIGGVALWTLSPLLFHSQMSVLLILLMFTNMVAGVAVLPCFIAWARPRFVVGYGSATGRRATPQALEEDRDEINQERIARSAG